LRTEPESERDPSLEYVARVNRAVDHILGNLDQPLSLETVARVARFSPFHFHRVFRALIGETLNQFVKRLRLERALYILSHRADLTLTEVALECGFASSSDFSRSFKQRYGVPPSAFDIETFRARRREDWQSAIRDPKTRHLLDRLPVGENPDRFEVTLRRLPARRVAYVRVLDPYRPDVVFDAAARLMAWAEQRGLADGQWLGYMWDDPEIVAHELCRYDVGLEAREFQPEGEVGSIEFPAMTVAQVEVRGGIDLETRALDWLFETWLPASGYVPTKQPAFEAWIGRPFAHGLEHFELYAQLPVERA
jgi:AraC family transcriptional regulator